MALHPLALPGDPPAAGNVFLAAVRGLDADTGYELTARLPGGEEARARSRTLPAQLVPGAPFTLALGSCYCLARDPGLHSFYPPVAHRPEGADPVRLRLLAGDQIYMDLSPVDGGVSIFRKPDPWQRYPDQWGRAGYAEFLRESPSLLMADDHEFWNDYPHGNAHIPWDERDLLGPLGRSMDRAFSLFQAAFNLEAAAITGSPQALATQLADEARTFALTSGPLRLFVLDTRTRRTRYDAGKPGLAPSSWLTRALDWIRRLDGPGVLVLSQPLVEERASWWSRTLHTMGDVNLPDYPADFAALWEALFAADFDVLVLSGDIHWSRVYELERATTPGRRVHEVISSSLARIPYGKPETGEPSGKVKWQQGLARWTRREATTEPATYTTVTLTALGSILAEGVRVKVAAWKRPEDTTLGAHRIYAHEIKLT